ADDPRFAWSARSRVDLDVAQYPSGRVTLLFDNEIVLGRERREFDFNHGNIVLEASGTRRIAGMEAGGVFHHTSRHIIDRAASRVVAWHSVGGRVVRPIPARRVLVVPSVEYHQVVQHTFVDYTWVTQAALRLDHPLERGPHVFAAGSVAPI